MVEVGKGAARKAREQVGAHGNAGHDHFADVRKMITAGKGAEREVPDVHLTRFAAYFVALNADQSKPESTAHDTPMRGCTIQRPNAVECYGSISCRSTISLTKAKQQVNLTADPY